MEIANQTSISLDVLGNVLSAEDKIRFAATSHKVDVSTALNIACSESMFEASAKNKYSSAGGVYQFLDGSWKAYGLKYWGTLEGRDKFDENDNIELAMLVLADTGTRDWNSSKWSGPGGGWGNKPYEKGLCTN